MFLKLFTHRLSPRSLSTMPGKFRFTDYDCIGFDLDNTLARYKIGNMVELEYRIMSRYLVTEKGYPRKHLLQPPDHDFMLKGLIVDDENGNVVQLGPDGRILQATHGTRRLSAGEIAGYYPDRHWKATDLFVEDPLQTWNGPYSEKMRTLLDYYDTVVSLVFARAVDAVDESNVNDIKSSKRAYNVWPDVLECLVYMFDRQHFSTDRGEYFPALKSDPGKYYHKCTASLVDWLKSLKSRGKGLFLVTGSHVDFASHTATNTIGPDWRDLFDLTVTYAKKPGFFTNRRDFLGLDGHVETAPVPFDQLRTGRVYSQGNWEDLKRFMLTGSRSTTVPKILYVGDNLVQDVYTPKVHSNCDTVAVCEELQVECPEVYGDRWHPDEEVLRSTIWGSYFRCKDPESITNWYHLMRTYSDLCVPSMEYVATFPVDHEFPVGHLE